MAILELLRKTIPKVRRAEYFPIAEDAAGECDEKPVQELFEHNAKTDLIKSQVSSVLEIRRGERSKRGWLQVVLSHAIAALIPTCIVWLLATKDLNSQDTALLQSPIPKFPSEIRTFEWNYTFTDLRSPKSETAWKSLLPFGRGYVFVEDPAQYSLPPGDPTPNGEIYSVALYHQLHCLGVIRRDYFDLLDGVQNILNSNGSSAQKVALQDMEKLLFHQIENSHNRHCMDYLRQTLECNADMTIEWERTEADGSRFQVDGMHIAHECTRKEAVFDFMREQQTKVMTERDLKGGIRNYHEIH